MKARNNHFRGLATSRTSHNVFSLPKINRLNKSKIQLNSFYNQGQSITHRLSKFDANENTLSPRVTLKSKKLDTSKSEISLYTEKENKNLQESFDKLHKANNIKTKSHDFSKRSEMLMDTTK